MRLRMVRLSLAFCLASPRGSSDTSRTLLRTRRASPEPAHEVADSLMVRATPTFVSRRGVHRGIATVAQIGRLLDER